MDSDCDEMRLWQQQSYKAIHICELYGNGV